MNSQASHFFAWILTRRHLLTKRIALMGCVAAALLIPTGLWVAAELLPTDASGSNEAAAQNAQNVSSSGSAAGLTSGVRLLRVAARPLAQAGPSSLQQTYTGIVSAARTSRLAAKDVARVESVMVDLGDQVAAGQLLIQLDIQQLVARRDAAMANLKSAQATLDERVRGPRRQDIEQADARVSELQANLDLSRANLERIQELRRSSAISIQEFDEARFALEAVEAQLESANQNLERLREGTRQEQIDAQTALVNSMEAQLRSIEADIEDRCIRAPFAGSIQSRMIDEGAVVSPGQTLLEIMEDPPYEVRVGLPPGLVNSLSDSQIHVSYGDQQLEATLQRVAPGLNEQSRTREVVLQLTESASHFVGIGNAVNVTLQVPVRGDGFWVPTGCLTAGPRGLWAVYIASPVDVESFGEPVYKIERRQVTLLRAQGTWSEVQGPVAGDDLLVFEGVHRVTPGQTVQLTRPESGSGL